MAQGAKKERDTENEMAIGGMRNPRRSAQRLPGTLMMGAAIGKLLLKAAEHPSVQKLVADLTEGRPATQVKAKLTNKVRNLVLKVLNVDLGNMPSRTAKAETPLHPEVLWAWGQATDDPDACTLAEWLRIGAPLGFSEDIKPTGVFPVVDGQPWEQESADLLHRCLEGWSNYSSAVEEKEDLNRLIQEAKEQGFCTFYDTLQQVESELGVKPVLNKLGVIVKIKESGVRKARIIWDLRESKINSLCRQGERVILPRLRDAIADANETYRQGGRPRFLAVDITNAFHNIPAGRDRAYTAAAFESPQGRKILVYDVLVFGSVSSPTLWGRFAAWLSRSLMATCPNLKVQTYVDDPLITYDEKDPNWKLHLGAGLLWFEVTGFPLKLAKADAGSQVTWIGASIETLDDLKATKVTIPKEKIEELLKTCETFMSRPVVGRRQLRSFAGALSFVAGVVPHVRPFLASLWAVVAQANDGQRTSGKLVHTRRIGQALNWIAAFLRGETCLTRTVRSHRPKSSAMVITDASTHGMGGVLFKDGEPTEFFSLPIPSEFILRFRASTGDPKHMALWEALTILIAARLWLVKFPLGAVVKVRADNISALYMVLKCKAKSPDLSVVAREMAIDQARGLYEFTLLSHIYSKDNVLADALSRLYEPKPAEFPAALHKCQRIEVQIQPDFWKVK